MEVAVMMIKAIMRPFSIQEGDSPVIAAAIHDGHFVHAALRPYMLLGGPERSPEEDPYTGFLAGISPNRVMVHVSRFEVDMNRPREKAIYREPDDAWGLQVWKGKVPAWIVRRSMSLYDTFYARIQELIRHTIERCGHFAVLDIHSYNYKRNDSGDAGESGDGGESGSASPQKKEAAGTSAWQKEPAGAQPQSERAEKLRPEVSASGPQPEINIGTLHNHRKWRSLTRGFIEALACSRINGHAPDVRENINFMGGEFSRRINGQYGQKGCVLSIEFKKIFMDETTGIVNVHHLLDMKRALSGALSHILNRLAKPLEI